MTAAVAARPATTAPICKGELINRILGAAKSAAIVSNRYAEYQASAADTFITLAFKSEDELRSIARKIGVLR